MLLMDHSMSCLQCFPQESTVRGLGNSSVRAFLLFVFKKLDARSEASQVRGSSPWLGSASVPALPVCRSAALPCLGCPCKGLGVWAQRRGKDRVNKRDTQNEDPLCLVFLLSLLLVVRVKAAYSDHPSLLTIFNLGWGWRAECDLVFFLAALGML